MSKRVLVLLPFLSAFLLLGFGFLLLSPPAMLRAAPDAALLQVDRLDDPALPTGTGCTAAPNDCTLRGAVDKAVDGDTIEVAVTGLITLNNQIVLTKSLTITGSSPLSHAIDGNGSHVIFNIEPDAFLERIVVLEGLTLQNGFNATGSGGAIVMKAGTLTMTNVVLQDNVATARGGALDISPLDNHAFIFLSEVTFRNNRALTSTLSGGAINAVARFMVPVELYIENGSFENNVGGDATGGDGGAIMADAHLPGANLDLEIRNTTFISNGSVLGGALSLKSFAEEPGGSSSLETLIFGSDFTDNQGELGGAVYMESAGVQSEASLTISNTTFMTNSADRGGALHIASLKGVGMAAANSYVTIHNSTFHNNQATLDDGGAIYNRIVALNPITQTGAVLELVNVTLSGNRATGNGGALFATTSGVTHTSSVMTATHITAFDNSSAAGTDVGLQSTQFSENTLYLKNSILGGSAGASCTNSGGAISGANNLIQDTSCGSGSPFRLGSPLGIISTLADNGGATPTHGLYAGSNALDAVPAGQCTTGSSATVVTTDQRDEPRPFGAACDIGAFEAQTTTLPALPGVTGLTAENDGPTVVNNPILFTAAITGGEQVSYTWDFGDGGSGSGITTTHTYTQSGIYTATVVAGNPTNSLTATTTVYVGNAIVEVGNNFYDPNVVVVPVGGSVVWVLRAGNHSVTAEDGSFEQPAATDWPPFLHTFTVTDTVDYYCTVHGFAMRGKVIVGDVGLNQLHMPKISKGVGL